MGQKSYHCLVCSFLQNIGILGVFSNCPSVSLSENAKEVLANWVLLVPFLYRFMKCSYKTPKGKTIGRADGTVTRPLQVQVRCPNCDKIFTSLTRIKDNSKIFKSW